MSRRYTELKKGLMMWALRTFVHTRRPYATRIRGLTIMVLPGVFSPRRVFNFRVSEFLADQVVVGSNDRVLEIGTGTGVIALLLSRKAGHVVATDINPTAVACARGNAARNRCANVEVRQGDLFAPIAEDERFDAILFNLPFYFGTPRSDLDHAYYCGESGELVHRFAAELGRYLEPHGRAYFLFASIEGDRFVPDVFAANGLTLRSGAQMYVFGLDRVVAYTAEVRADELKETA